MTNQGQVFECELCSRIVTEVRSGTGDLVCCGSKMTLLEEKRLDKGKEKHVPVILPKNDGILVSVGLNPHPMTEKHHIQWIEARTENKILRNILKPGQPPETAFINVEPESTAVNAYCNLHGLWKA